MSYAPESYKLKNTYNTTDRDWFCKTGLKSKRSLLLSYFTFNDQPTLTSTDTHVKYTSIKTKNNQRCHCLKKQYNI